MIFIPKENKAIICCYRPPNCPSKQFKEAVTVVEDWLINLESEQAKAPAIVIAGDFNLPEMKTWSIDDIEEYSNNPLARQVNGSSVGRDKEQALCIIDLISKLGLTQEVNEITHGKNVLDLIFTTDPEMMEEIEIIENVKVSDHKFVIAYMEKSSSCQKEEQKTNFCSTIVPKYNLRKAPPDIWEKTREQFDKCHIDEEDNVQNQVDILIDALEDAVKTNFPLHAPPDRTGMSSKSFIPREAKRLMKIKIRASRAIKKTSDVDKVSALEKKIETAEEDLRKLVHVKRTKEELRARSDLKKRPEDLYDLISKLTKRSQKIGPLKRNKNNKDDTTAEVLNDQYKSVFSTPRSHDIITNPREFFRTPNITREDVLNEDTEVPQ